MLIKTFLLMAMLAFSFSTGGLAAVITLKSGEKIEGKIVGQTDQYVKMDTGVGEVVTYYNNEIDTIDGQKFQTTSVIRNLEQPRDQPYIGPTNTSAEAVKPVDSENEDISVAGGFMRIGEYDLALLVLNRLIKNGSNNFLAYGYGARCLEEMNDHDGALEDYFKAVKLDPEKGIKLYKTIAFIYLEKGNGAQAGAWFQNYLRNFPHDAESYFGIAIARYDMDDYIGALNNLHTAERLGYRQNLDVFRKKILAAQSQVESQQAKDSYARQHFYLRPSSSSNLDIGYALFGLCFGVCFFYYGFIVLRKKRLLANIPNSTVRGLALGLAGLNGKAKKTKTLKSPLTWTECIFYRYTIERHERNDRSGRWVLVANGDSTFCPFCLDDGTGRIMVLPRGAEFIMPADYIFTAGLGQGLPDNLINFMAKNSLQYKGTLGDHTLRFSEWYIKPDEPVFIAGTAQVNSVQLNVLRGRLTDRLDELKQNAQQASVLDLSKEDSIVPEGWKRAANNTEYGLLQEENESNLNEDSTDVIITKGKDGQIFIVSDENQTEIARKSFWRVFAGIWGGAALSLAMLAYLFLRFGLWPMF